MRTIKYSLLPVLAIFLLISSCKRESEFTKSSVTSSSEGSKAKAWLDSQSKNKGPADIPEWSKTKYLSRNNLFLTPVKISGYEKMNSGRKVTKFFVTSENSTGEINAGEYVYIIEKSMGINGKENNLERLNSIAANSFQNQKISSDFNGIILRYDLNYKLIESGNFANGEISNDLVSLVAKEDGNKNSEISSFAEVPCGVCIDWYLQTIDLETGQILSEIYLYTQCGNQACEGSGGGGTSVPQSVYNGLMTLVNSITISNETKSVTTLSETPEQRVKRLEWKLVKGIGWYIYSWEKGVQVKVASSNPSTQWQWQSITHEGSAKVGIIIGGTVSHSITYWNAILGLYNAIVDVQLAVTCSVGWRGSPVSYDLVYSCQKNFNVNESYE